MFKVSLTLVVELSVGNKMNIERWHLRCLVLKDPFLLVPGILFDNERNFANQEIMLSQTMSSLASWSNHIIEDDVGFIISSILTST